MTEGRLSGPMREFPGRVAEVLDEYRFVLNRGRRDGVHESDRFVVYSLGEEITDPETGDSLGHLEITKGTAEVIHVQEKMSTLISADTKQKRVQDIFSAMGSEPRTKTVRLPLEEVTQGDYVKPK